MKKASMMLLAALCLLFPQTGAAQGLPEFMQAVGQGLDEGLQQGIEAAQAVLSSELTLALACDADRIEEGQTVTLSVTAGNPLPADMPVNITLMLPQRLTAAGNTQWEAVLPAAKTDPQTGETVPSVSVFDCEVSLAPGGESGTLALMAEMAMGTRFYRAQTTLDACVSDVHAAAQIPDAGDGRLTPGTAFCYRVEITNAGLAAKKTGVALTLPQGAELAGELPEGFALRGGVIEGSVLAPAAQEDETGAAASLTALEFPVRVREDALEDDEDAVLLLAGSLTVDGQRVPLPRLQVCQARISARLIPQAQSLAAGEEMDLGIMVVNAGLVGAKTEVSCVLPEGLTFVKARQEATQGDAQAVSASAAEDEDVTLDGNTLRCSLYMDAASEAEGGIAAASAVRTFRVRAAQEIEETALLGASLAWRTDDGQTQLGEAVALKVYEQRILGLKKGELNSMFWAAFLLIATVFCLYAAVRSEHKEDVYE